MRIGPILFLMFLLVPLLEVYLLIQVGSVVGVGWTIFAVVFTAILGAALVRRQGFSMLSRIQKEMDRGQLPAVEMLEGVFLLVAGALLLTPGFFTDAVGFACLTPPLRIAIIRFFIQKKIVQPRTPGTGKPGGGDSLEGEFRRVDD